MTIVNAGLARGIDGKRSMNGPAGSEGSTTSLRQRGMIGGSSWTTSAADGTGMEMVWHADREPLWHESPSAFKSIMDKVYGHLADVNEQIVVLYQRPFVEIP